MADPRFKIECKHVTFRLHMPRAAELTALAKAYGLSENMTINTLIQKGYDSLRPNSTLKPELEKEDNNA